MFQNILNNFDFWNPPLPRPIWKCFSADLAFYNLGPLHLFISLFIYSSHLSSHSSPYISSLASYCFISSHPVNYLCLHQFTSTFPLPDHHNPQFVNLLWNFHTYWFVWVTYFLFPLHFLWKMSLYEIYFSAVYDSQLISTIISQKMFHS